MIKNVIFDFGMVLVEFIPTDMVAPYAHNDEEVQLMADVIFDRLYWDKLDAGTISDEEVVASVRKRLPAELGDRAEKAYYDWIYNIPDIEGMADIVRLLKDNGKEVCILSNISKYFAAHYKEIPVLEHFDKLVFSSTCGLQKPDERIFRYTAEKFGFKPEETLFVDDKQSNVDGAINTGMQGYCFDGDVEKFRKYIEENVIQEKTMENIKAQARTAIIELCDIAQLKRGDLMVIGCSSSEIVGGKIGKNSSLEAAQAVFAGIYPELKERGIYLAAQCCEHLNRALIIEAEAAERFGYEVVCVVPQPKAGGSFATTAFANFKSPVAVETVKAKAGIDIGGTLIGMSLRHVAVPVRLSIDKIGEANIICARTRPKYIGGERAKY